MTFPLTKEDVNLILHALQPISDDVASSLRERLLSHYFQQAGGIIQVPGLGYDQNQVRLSIFKWCFASSYDMYDVSRPPTLHQSLMSIHTFHTI